MNVVFDLDGTLCDTSKRELLAANAAREATPEVAQRVWDEFHAGIPNDSPVHPIKKTLLALAGAGHAIEIWTARPEKYQGVTVAWLRKHGVPFNHLLMRGDQDRRPSPIVKLEWFFLSYPKPELVFEDHPETVKLLRQAGCCVAFMGDGRAHV